MAENLAKSLMEVKEKIKFCSICFNLTDYDICSTCRDINRANGVICIVEGPGDQLAIEESGIFKGRYRLSSMARSSTITLLISARWSEVS